MAGDEKTQAGTDPQQTGGLPAGGTDAGKLAVTPIRAGGKDYASAEELSKAYEAVQSELGKWTQQYGDLKKQHEEVSAKESKWTEWWKGIQPLWGDDVEAFLRQKLNGGAQAQAQQAQQQQVGGKFDGFDLLRPEEQAARVQQAVMEQVAKQLGQQWQQYQQQMQKYVGERENWYQTYMQTHMGLLRKALERKIKDPSFDVDAVMEQAVKAMGGQLDPLELGQQLLSASTYQSQLEAAKKAAYDQGKKDLEQELANKKVETMPAGAGELPVFKRPSTPAATGKHGLGGLRQRAAEALAEKFGPGVFRE